MLLLLILLGWAAPGALLAGNIDRVELSDRQVTLRFDDLVAGASAMVLAGPDRIAVDVDGAQAGRGGPGSGLVRAVRQGQQNPDRARVVLDLVAPAVITASRFGTDGRSLTLSLVPVSAEEFARTSRQRRINVSPPAGFSARRPEKRYSVTQAIGTPRPALPLPRVEGPDDGALPLVVIDAGHGGHDPGAISPHTGAHEKAITLALARAARAALLATGRVRVALTREDDRFLVLQERYGIARRLQADLFISIHADSAESQDARGASVYTLSEVASDREAARLATRENKANIINGVDLSDVSSDVSSILLDLTQRETMNLAADFARLLTREGSRAMTFRSNAHRFASFVVLKSPDTPSILFETGFLSNADDARFLGTREGQQRVARGLADAVQTHFARQIAGR